MIIDSAKINMQAQHRQLKYQEHSERLQIQRTIRPNPPAEVDDVKVSTPAQTNASEKTSLDLKQSMNAEQSLTLQIIRRMFKSITGQELQLFSPAHLQDNVDGIDIQAPTQPPKQPETDTTWVYEQSAIHAELESTTFSAEGKIITRDGQQIEFSASLSMSREFYSAANISATNAPKKDPLVINFDGNAAELSTNTFQFDIDANGSLDQIALLKSNSGLLALDKNADGVINDGSELFGAQSGDGFQELAAYDDDGNQFIDAGDAIYDKLRIWQRHADGSQQLLALGDKNIGALFLGHLTTPFQLKNGDNQSLGEVASSSIYLTEQGSVGSVQQINFTV